MKLLQRVFYGAVHVIMLEINMLEEGQTNEGQTPLAVIAEASA